MPRNLHSWESERSVFPAFFSLFCLTGLLDPFPGPLTKARPIKAQLSFKQGRSFPPGSQHIPVLPPGSLLVPSASFSLHSPQKGWNKSSSPVYSSCDSIPCFSLAKLTPFHEKKKQINKPSVQHVLLKRTKSPNPVLGNMGEDVSAEPGIPPPAP